MVDRPVPRRASARLAAETDRLRRDGVVELHLATLADLTDTSVPVEAVIGVLVASRSFPESLTVRVVLTESSPSSTEIEDARVALAASADERALEHWKQAMEVQALGRRQLPLGIALSAVAAVVAYGVAYVAQGSGRVWSTLGLLLAAGIAITVAWVFSWMVIETRFLDWRPMGRTAAAYELVADSALEVLPSPSGSAHATDD